MELIQAASIAPPVEPYVRLATASSVAHKLPVAFRGTWITIQADGADLYLRFGTATLTVDEANVSTITADEAAPAATGAITIPAGQERHYDLRRMIQSDRPDDHRIWMALKSASATGHVRWWKSSGKV